MTSFPSGVAAVVFRLFLALSLSAASAFAAHAQNTLTTATAVATPSQFADIPLGTGRVFAVTLTNTGTQPLVFGGLPRLPADVQTWSGTQSCVYPQPGPSESCTVEFLLYPTAIGPGSATIVVPLNVPGGGVSVTLTWNVVAFPLEVAGAPLDFGETQVGSSTTRVLTVTNKGSSSQTIAPAIYAYSGCIGVPSPPCAEQTYFERESYRLGSSCPTLMPGESCSLHVEFRPLAERVLRSILVIDSAGVSVRVDMTGYGVPPQPSPDTVLAVEYLRTRIAPPRRFFTALRDEIDKLDRDVVAGWERTGEAFWVLAPGFGGAPASTPVCRFYGRPEAGLDAHFYSASPAECAEVQERFSATWLLESAEIFRAYLPDPVTGACPLATKALYRTFNPSGDVQHVFTRDAEFARYLKSVGWIAEGYGADGVAMCVLQ